MGIGVGVSVSAGVSVSLDIGIKIGIDDVGVGVGAICFSCQSGASEMRVPSPTRSSASLAASSVSSG